MLTAALVVRVVVVVAVRDVAMVVTSVELMASVTVVGMAAAVEVIKVVVEMVGVARVAGSEVAMVAMMGDTEAESWVEVMGGLMVVALAAAGWVTTVAAVVELHRLADGRSSSLQRGSCVQLSSSRQSVDERGMTSRPLAPPSASALAAGSRDS